MLLQLNAVAHCKDCGLKFYGAHIICNPSVYCKLLWIRASGESMVYILINISMNQFTDIYSI